MHILQFHRHARAQLMHVQFPTQGVDIISLYFQTAPGERYVVYLQHTKTKFSTCTWSWWSSYSYLILVAPRNMRASLINYMYMCCIINTKVNKHAIKKWSREKNFQIPLGKGNSHLHKTCYSSNARIDVYALAVHAAKKSFREGIHNSFTYGDQSIGSTCTREQETLAINWKFSWSLIFIEG